MNKAKFTRYNDGVISIYREKAKRTDFAAKKNVSELDNLDFIVKLAYAEVSKREQDIDFAQQNGFSLTLKVRTRFHGDVDNKCKAIINNYLYDVSYVDKNRVEMWLYLEGVRRLVTE